MIAASEIVTIERGFPAAMIPRLWEWLNSPRRASFDDFGTTDYEQFVKDIELRLQGARVWAIYSDDAVVGYLEFAAHSPICGQFHGLVIAPGHRGRGIGIRAFEGAMQELFRAGFKKFISMPFADNKPIKVFLETLGFRQEGYITSATEIDGFPMDIRVMCYPGEPGARG